MVIKSLFTTIVILFSYSKAQAILEARLTYGSLASNPQLSDVYTGSASEVPAVAPNYGLGVDALIIFPVVGFGFGARYENLGFKVDNAGLEYKTSTTRTALLVNYRLLNTFFFLGPIATYGISHTNNMKWSVSSPALSVPTTAKGDLIPQSSTSYSLGIEAGIKMLNFLLGAEVGYEDFKWKKMTDSTGNLTTTPDLNMNGVYTKVMFGFGI